MAEKTVVENLRAGLHARPAAWFVQQANKYESEIFVEKAGKSANVKSIMGIMSQALSKGSEFTIKAEGSDAKRAVETLADMVARKE